MKDLIEALQILIKYGDKTCSTDCTDDYLNIMGVQPSNVSDEDNERLHKLGFYIDEECDMYRSVRFGSFYEYKKALDFTLNN